MSSDSDDLDEDELLQIALKEQSQRDLNYRQPSSKPSRPVANFVQPPPQPVNHRGSTPRNPSSTAQQMQKGQQRRSMDDDDDSEVEMLSISSGDEDSSKDRGFGSRNRVGSGGRARKDDDVAWDGGEPDCWKRVDEAELARRVREMRETRAVPVAPKIERKPSAIARKGLNNLQSFPRGMECIDPLGLGIIDNKTLRLITEYSESSPSKSDKDYLDSNLRGKAN